MTYSSGNTISSVDYNILAWGSSGGNTYLTSPANAAVSYGVGSGRYGLGGSVTGIAAVSTGNTVTAAQWASLISTINNTRNFQSSGYSAISSVSVGNTISAIAAISTENTNSLSNVGLSSLALTDSSPTNLSRATAWGGAALHRLVFTQSLTFASGDQARYFFNAGGKVKISFSRTGGAATTRNSNWDALIAACGTITVGYQNTTKTGGSGSTNILLNSTNGGYWNLSTTPTAHFKQFAVTAPYTTDYIAVNVSWSGTLVNGGAPTVTFTVWWDNDYINSLQQTVDGTATTSFVLSSPNSTLATTYLGSSTWGTPTWPTGSVTDT